jgi:hypothetical protein
MFIIPVLEDRAKKVGIVVIIYLNGQKVITQFMMNWKISQNICAARIAQKYSRG